jgi:hypothetical protein
MGKAYANMMVDLMATSEKLVERSRRTVMTVAGVDYDAAARAIEAAGKSVKTAIVMLTRMSCPPRRRRPTARRPADSCARRSRKKGAREPRPRGPARGRRAGPRLLACAPAKQEVVFWQFWPVEVVQPLIDQFEKENPGLEVRMEQLTWQSGLEKITAAMASGNVPDLCELGSTWMPRMLDSGQLADWSAGVADLRPALRGWELCSIGDAIYGMPWVMGTRALFFNRTLFARAGLDRTAPQ